MKPHTRFAMLPQQAAAASTTGASVTASALAQARSKMNLPTNEATTGKLKPHSVLMEEGRSLLACLMKMNQQRSNQLETNATAAPPSPKKRSAGSESDDQEAATVTHKRQRTRKVSWDDNHRVFLQEDASKKFSDYDEAEIWYGVSTIKKENFARTRGKKNDTMTKLLPLFKVNKVNQK